MQPSIFLSHGAPVLPLLRTPASRFLAGLGADIEARHDRPSAILVASAHWETAQPRVSAMARNATIHDFHGFPAALSQLRYPAPGAPDLAGRVVGLLDAAGLPSGLDPQRGLDHGAWCPLILARGTTSPCCRSRCRAISAPRITCGWGRRCGRCARRAC